MEKVAEVRSGKKTVSTRKLYPGYVFIDIALLDDNNRIIEKPWYFIRDTPGIIGFVGGERGRPHPPRRSSRSNLRSRSPKIRNDRRSILTWVRPSRSMMVRSSI